MTKLVALVALFAAGLALAGGLASVGVADITTTTTETVPTTETVEQTTTAPAQTVLTTVERTTTAPATLPTTTAASSSEKTPTWVWIVLAILAVAVVGLAAALIARRGSGLPPAELQRRLEAAVRSWTTQGWAVESQRPGETILRRGPEVMAVGIDDKGQISTRPLAG
jgi:beta-lactamase regulating signal transducer with metallopeptidase domain